MQHLAAQLAHDVLTGTSAGTSSAQPWSALSPAATSVRLAAVVAEDVLAISGNLAAAGRIGWALLPSTSVAGRCVATGAPALIEAHSSIQRKRSSSTACRGLCRSTLYVPVLKDGCAGSGGFGTASSSSACCGCLVLSFRCSQHAAMLRSASELARLGAEMAEVLPAAIGPLRQMLTTVLRQPADPAAVGTTVAVRPADGSGSGAMRPPRSILACGDRSLDASEGTAEDPASGSSDGSGSGRRELTPAGRGVQTCSAGQQKCTGAQRRRSNRLPVALPVQVAPAMNPLWLQYSSKQREAAFAKWYALQNWQWDVCMLVVCLASLVARLLRLSDHAFRIVPAASAAAAGAVLLAFCIAAFCHRWYLARRELVLMLVWGCIAHLAVMLAELVPLWTPLWAARVLALETALCVPVTFRVRFVHALPIMAVKCFASLSILPQVLGCSMHASAAMRLCTVLAQIAQVFVFLVAPLFARHRVEKRLRQQFDIQQPVAADAEIAAAQLSGP